MKAPEFLKYYRNPALLGEDTLPLLRQMVTAFPWFREGWMLYLKNLKNLGHPDYETILHEVALRVNDRQRLKLFLEGDPTRKWDAASAEKEYLPADFQGEERQTSP